MKRSRQHWMEHPLGGLAIAIGLILLALSGALLLAHFTGR